MLENDQALAAEIRQRIALKMAVQINAYREEPSYPYRDLNEAMEKAGTPVVPSDGSPESIGVVVGDNLVLIKHRQLSHPSARFRDWLGRAVAETMDELGVPLWHVL